MRFPIFLLLLLSLPFVGSGQAKDSIKTGSLAGVIKDSVGGNVMQYVTISLFRKADSTILDYQLSGPQGEFHFKSVPLMTPVILDFSFTGYKSASRIITIDSAHRDFKTKDVFLARGYGTLEEVVVQAVVPIKMNGDTLEINPGAFKLDSNAVVEDMLRRVPGMTLWGDGSITVNGKEVNKVLVDGKQFFANDPAIATQNLPKNAIDKIQVYQETDYSKDNAEVSPSDSLLTMNIKLKPNKRSGYFGKAGGGLGTDKRYEADLAGQAYNNKSRFGLVASANNINKSADMQSIQQQSTFRSFNPRNRYVANFGGQGVNEIRFLGANLQHNFAETNNNWYNNQATASFTIRENMNEIDNLTNARSSASGKVFLTNTRYQSQGDNISRSFSAGYNNRNRNRDFSTDLNANMGSGSGTSSSVTHSALEGEGAVSDNNARTSYKNENQGLNFTARLRNRGDDERNLKSFSLSNSLAMNSSRGERNTQTLFESLADISKNKNINRLYETTSSSFSNTLSANYNALKRLLFGGNSLWNINMGVSNDLTFSSSSNTSDVQDFNKLTGDYQINGYLTNNNELNRFEDRPSFNISKSFNKNLSDRYSRWINVYLNLRGQFLTEHNSSSIANRNLNRSFGFFVPGFSLNYNYQRHNRYRIDMNISQNRSASIPSVDQLFPIIDSTNTYSFNHGNPYLNPAYSNYYGFNLNYNRQNRQRKTDIGFGVYGNMNISKDAVSDSTYYDNLGRRNIYLINMNGRSNYSSGFNMNTSFKFKKNILQLRYSGNLNNGNAPTYIDGIYSLSRNNSINNNFNVMYAIADLATFQASQSIALTNNTQSGKNLKSFKNTSYITNGSINIKYPKNVTFSNSVNYVKNKSTQQSAVLWNSFLTYRFLKSQQAEAKFSAMDILKQNKNISTYAGVNNLTTTVSNGLQQFFMITLSYYPRKFGKNENRGRNRNQGVNNSRAERTPDIKRSEKPRGNNPAERPRGNRNFR
jgi:hypothetical protein